MQTKPHLRICLEIWKTRQNHMQTCCKITEQSCDSGSHSTCMHRYISMVKISFAGSNSRQMLDRCKVHNQDVPTCVMLICWGSPISSWRSTCSVAIDFQDPSCACKCNSVTYKKTVLYTWSVAAILPRMIFHGTCSMTIMTRCMHTLVEVAITNRASCKYHWVATHLQLWLVQYGVPQDSWTASC